MSSTKIKIYIILGALLSVLWAGSVLFIGSSNYDVLQNMSGQEMGDLIYTITAPLMGAWLAIGYLDLFERNKAAAAELRQLRQRIEQLEKK